MQNKTLSVSQLLNNDPRRRLVAQLKACPPNEAATLLVSAESSLAFEALTELNPSFTQDIQPHRDGNPDCFSIDL
jgi:hypothetical protein